ncbi:MAG: GyrI-like domain-containing protein, partial [Mucilaginibacter sp.]
MIAKTEISSQEQFYLTGISVRTTNLDGRSQNDIGGLWTRFTTGNLIMQINNRVSDDLYCAYTDYETDHTGPYTAVLGCRVSSPDDVPEGFACITVPGGTYQVFYLEGEFPASITNAWQHIWLTGIDRKYT